MSFYSEFIERCEEEYVNAIDLKVKATINPGIYKQVQEMAQGDIEKWSVSFKYFYDLAQSMRKAKIIRFSGQQAKLFLNTPRCAGQDYTHWLRLPYPLVWLNLDEPFQWTTFESYTPDMVGPFSQYKPLPSDRQNLAVKVRGILLEDKNVHDAFCEGTLIHPTNEAAKLTFEQDRIKPENIKGSIKFKDIDEEIPMRTIERIIGIHFISPLSETVFNEDSTCILIMRDGTLKFGGAEAYRQHRDQMITFVIHAINYLTSPSMKLVHREPDQALQRKRQRSGKEPLPGWYEIVWRKQINDYSKKKESDIVYHHSFRYDVRGNFASYTKGPMAGRVIWRPAHQRGLANSLYKPKVYRGENQPGQLEEIWRG